MSNSCIKLIGSIGSFIFAADDIRDSCKEKRELEDGRKKIDQQMQKLGVSVAKSRPEIQSSIRSSTDGMVENVNGRTKAANLTLAAGACNSISATINGVTSALELGGDTSSALGFLQHVGTKMGWGISGATSALKGGFQTAACLKAAKKTMAATDSRAAQVHKLNAINQGVQAVASLTTAGASLASVFGITVALGAATTVTPIIIVGGGAGALSYGANYYFRKKIANIRLMNNSPEALKALLEVDPAHHRVESLVPAIAALQLMSDQRPSRSHLAALPPQDEVDDEVDPESPDLEECILPGEIVLPTPDQEEKFKLVELRAFPPSRKDSVSKSDNESEESQKDVVVEMPPSTQEEARALVQEQAIRECDSCIIS